MAVQVYFLTSDNTLQLTGLQDQLTSSFVNSATVTVTLTNKATGAQVAGQSWPTTMTYVTSSDGNYRGNLVDVLTVSEFDELEATIDADDGPSRKLTIFLPVQVLKKKS